MFGVLNGIAEFLPVLRDRPDPAARAIVIVGSKLSPPPPSFSRVTDGGKPQQASRA